MGAGSYLIFYIGTVPDSFGKRLQLHFHVMTEMSWRGFALLPIRRAASGRKAARFLRPALRVDVWAVETVFGLRFPPLSVGCWPAHLIRGRLWLGEI